MFDKRVGEYYSVSKFSHNKVAVMRWEGRGDIKPEEHIVNIVVGNVVISRVRLIAVFVNVMYVIRWAAPVLLAPPRSM